LNLQICRNLVKITGMHYETLRSILKTDGASLTKPRKIIFDLMLNQGPQSMQVLVQRAKDRVDRATVYRTIELFERLGIVHRLNIGWKYKIELSDLFTNCGRMFDLPDNPMLETMIDTVAAKSSFAPRGHQLEVYGLCQSCSKG
ncbi:transcriptional repressor, partial [Candidatus Saccharibacteria bacterium]|nr:transcriptional repressor [Candidatus Saccharibacteria bacterium]